MEKTKTCSRCGNPKPLDDFKTDIRKPDGKASSCKACNAVPKVADLPVARSRALVPVYDPLDPAGWITRISERWRASVEAIFDVGRLLIEAKASLPHGTFGDMCETELPFSSRTAQRLMAIAQDIRLTNPTHVSLLPASWGTLAALTELTDDEFSSALKQKIISPNMIRADVEQIKALTRPQVSQAKATEGKAGTAGVDGPVRRSTTGTGLQVGEVARTATVVVGDTSTVGTLDQSPMPSGGLAIAHRRVEEADSLDFFPTPPWATRALIERVFVHLERRGHCKFQTVWEPACGQGHMAEVLKEYFRAVYASDVAQYGYGDSGDIDFLEKETSGNDDWIITNPPFNDSAEFVLKALKLAGTGVAMFVRLSWLESVGRYEKIFRDHPPTLVSIFTERVPLHKGRWEEDGTTMTAYMWLVWIKGAEPRAPFWIPPGQREALTKADDGKRFGKKTTEAA